LLSLTNQIYINPNMIFLMKNRNAK